MDYVEGHLRVDDFFNDTKGYTYATIFILFCYKGGYLRDRGKFNNRNIFNITIDWAYVTMSQNEYYNRVFCGFLDDLKIGWVENGKSDSIYIDGRELRADSPYHHPDLYIEEPWFDDLYVKFLVDDPKFQWLVKEFEE